MSDEIYPGDVVMLSRDKSKKKQAVPCDLVILSGSVVVNEAILTGESQPLVKEGISNLDQIDLPLDINNEHRNHILHSGTDIL
jgi:cation-transporting ATPase 13A1